MSKFTLVLVTTAFICCPVWAVNGNMGNGDGSHSNPYRIQDFRDFQAFCGDPSYWDDDTRLECNLDLSEAGTYDRAPIAGTSSSLSFDGTPFSGEFDGGGHVISNLTIDSSDSFIGLFGYIAGGAVTNVILENANVSGFAYIGQLCGWNEGQITGSSSEGVASGYSEMQGMRIGGLCGWNGVDGVISNCHADTNVEGRTTLGGLCGTNHGVIENSSSTGVMNCSAEPTGGFCGSNDGTITNCSANATVTGHYYFTGGFCGENTGDITGCYAKGIVTGDDKVGGFCGINWSDWAAGTIRDSYCSVAVTGNENVGGFCGSNQDMATVTNCYSTGTVTGNTSVKGFCGTQFNGGSITSSYWDVNTSGIGTSGDNNRGATGKNTDQMMTESTFAGWDFLTDWMMLREGEDYPRLGWQEIIPADIAGLYGVNIADLSYLAQYWGLSDCNGADDCARADIDASGDVGISDLAEIADNWLKGFAYQFPL